MRFVIIGGDAAGMSAASRAKRKMPEMDVTVLEKTGDVSYSACGMPYNIADPERDIDDLVVRKANVFREKQDIDLRTGHNVESIDRSAKVISGKNSDGEFRIPYDKLLIATGAEPITPDIPGISSPGVMVLKSLEHGRRIKDFISSAGVESAVIIGMGYIALEMCEALTTRNIQVSMVKPGPIFLPWMAPDLSEMVRTEVEKNSVKLYPGQEIKEIRKDNEILRIVCSDTVLECQVVIVAVGVNPNSGIAVEAGLETGPSGAISVDRRLQTSDKNIYAAGDCADAYHVVTGEKAYIPLALRANRAGWAVADNITGTGTELDGIAGTAVFKVFDLQVARTGLTAKEALKQGFDPVENVIKSNSRAHSHPGVSKIAVHIIGDRKSGRLLGMQMAGKEGAAHRINAAAVALHQGMTVQAFSQCDMAYAPPFSPVWDPMLTAANQLLKKM